MRRALCMAASRSGGGRGGRGEATRRDARLLDGKRQVSYAHHTAPSGTRSAWSPARASTATSSPSAWAPACASRLVCVTLRWARVARGGPCGGVSLLLSRGAADGGERAQGLLGLVRGDALRHQRPGLPRALAHTVAVAVAQAVETRQQLQHGRRRRLPPFVILRSSSVRQ